MNTAVQTARVPPQNLDAEESVLGAMLLSPRAIEAVQESGLRAEDFYRESHGTVFQTAREMHDAGEEVDAITLADRLEATGRLKTLAGGSDRVHELAALVPAASNAGHYATIVVEMAALRRLIVAGGQITNLGWDRPGDLPDLMARAEAALTAAVTATSGARAETFGDGLSEMLAEIREAYLTGVAIFGVPTGYQSLDAQLSGLWPGQLLLLAARPGNGKSTLALNIAENFADRGDACLFVSLEMSKYELRLRSLARAAKVDSRILGTGQMSVEQAKKLGDSMSIVKGPRSDNLHIQDDGAASIASIRAEARRLKRQKDLKLIVVDYLQLMQGGGEEKRNDQISTISRNLKLLARELEIPILALSQMNREVENRQGNRPKLSDLRDSGSLEQDADVVLFIHSDSHYDPDVEPDGTVELIVAKQRKGPTGTVKMAYNRMWSSFYNLKPPGAS